MSIDTDNTVATAVSVDPTELRRILADLDQFTSPKIPELDGLHLYPRAATEQQTLVAVATNQAVVVQDHIELADMVTAPYGWGPVFVPSSSVAQLVAALDTHQHRQIPETEDEDDCAVPVPFLDDLPPEPQLWPVMLSVGAGELRLMLNGRDGGEVPVSVPVQDTNVLLDRSLSALAAADDPNPSHSSQVDLTSWYVLRLAAIADARRARLHLALGAPLATAAGVDAAPVRVTIGHRLRAAVAQRECEDAVCWQVPVLWPDK